MNKTNRSKKPVTKDWSRVYIGYRLKLAGWTFSRLAKHYGYLSRCTLQHPLVRTWPKGERLLAKAIGVTPEEIWPSRYPAVCPVILDKSVTEGEAQPKRRRPAKKEPNP